MADSDNSGDPAPSPAPPPSAAPTRRCRSRPASRAAAAPRIVRPYNVPGLIEAFLQSQSQTQTISPTDRCFVYQAHLRDRQQPGTSTRDTQLALLQALSSYPRFEGPFTNTGSKHSLNPELKSTEWRTYERANPEAADKIYGASPLTTDPAAHEHRDPNAPPGAQIGAARASGYYNAARRKSNGGSVYHTTGGANPRSRKRARRTAASATQGAAAAAAPASTHGNPAPTALSPAPNSLTPHQQCFRDAFLPLLPRHLDDDDPFFFGVLERPSLTEWATPSAALGLLGNAFDVVVDEALREDPALSVIGRAVLHSFWALVYYPLPDRLRKGPLSAASGQEINRRLHLLLTDTAALLAQSTASFAAALARLKATARDATATPTRSRGALARDPVFDRSIRLHQAGKSSQGMCT
eukprot:COSAG05_NODE_3008_length_2418_cov_2.248383_2_plen_411_part_00